MFLDEQLLPSFRRRYIPNFFRVYQE
ncbi:hypothetical protein D299_gp168 [Escherichia phage HX01]|nr:hypothetical protein D299_gp168 [Escherichia phage HX01]